MKSKFFVFVSFWLLLFNYSSAQNLHLLVFANTDDISIGKGVEGNVTRIQKFFKDASLQINTTYSEEIISGSSFNCENLSIILGNLKNIKDNIFVFYYSGHGFRRPGDKSKFPRFYCGPEVHIDETPGLTNVVEKIRSEKPRLLIAVADTCNVLISDPTVPSKAFSFDSIDSSRKNAYINLFLKSGGEIVLSSSSPTQSSWYYTDSGIFTNQLLKSFEVSTKMGGKAMWEDFLKMTLKEISIPTGNAVRPIFIKQTPQADVSLKSLE
jgi:hypothetical protein